MITVKVIQNRGETGLRQPGSLYLLDESLAKKYETFGWIEIAQKEDKTVIETKELKLEKETKSKGRPKKK